MKLLDTHIENTFFNICVAAFRWGIKVILYYRSVLQQLGIVIFAVIFKEVIFFIFFFFDFSIVFPFIEALIPIISHNNQTISLVYGFYATSK